MFIEINTENTRDAKKTKAMKKNLLLTFAILSILSCGEFDDSEIWTELKNHKDRIEKLETLCNQVNTNIESLQTTIISLQNNDYVTNIAPIMEGSKQIGYTITFAKHGAITIYNGQDGKDGSSPSIGVCKDADNIYYWTLDNDWLRDNNGNQIPTSGSQGDAGKDGVTPQVKIENGYWCVSYDKGTTWEQLYQIAEDSETTEDPTCNIIDNVTQDDKFVYINLCDGNTIILPQATLPNVSLQINKISPNSVSFTGSINKKTVDLMVTIYYGEDDTISIYNNTKKVSLVNFGTEKNFSILIDGLIPAHKYYYFVEIVSDGKTTYSSIESFETDQINETDEPIIFEDAIAERVCLSKYDKNGDGKLSLSEVSSLESIDRFFFGEYAETVKSFNEFKYFTGVKELDYCQFEGCVNLQSITLPNSIENIGYQSFYDCKKLERIIIPNSVSTIGQSAFSGCRSLVDIVIPDNVTAMYSSAFYNCDKLSSVEIGDGLKVIPSTAFGWCNALSRIKFGASIEKIENNAFMPSNIAGSEEIKDVIIADLDKWIRVKFEGDYSSPTWIGANLWEGEHLVTKCTIPSDVLSTGSALRGCGSIEEVIISDGVLIIPDKAFWGCNNLKKATIGKDVVTIGKDAFWSCDKLSCFEGKFVSEDGRCIVVDEELVSHASAGLTEYTIPKGIKSIGWQAFSADAQIKVIIGNDVETIGKMAFYGSGTREAVIEESVKIIGEDAFGWTNMEAVYCKSAIPPTAEYTDIKWAAFYFTPLTNIYVPNESFEAYKTTDGWDEYASYIKPYSFN